MVFELTRPTCLDLLEQTTACSTVCTVRSACVRFFRIESMTCPIRPARNDVSVSSARTACYLNSTSFGSARTELSPIQSELYIFEFSLQLRDLQQHMDIGQCSSGLSLSCSCRTLPTLKNEECTYYTAEVAQVLTNGWVISICSTPAITGLSSRLKGSKRRISFLGRK